MEAVASVSPSLSQLPAWGSPCVFAPSWPLLALSWARRHVRSRLLPTAGVYVCAKCGYELFSSRSKYAHSSPWPAFTETVHADSVAKRPEHNRPEALKVSCGKCGNGLGHEFLNDGPKRGQSRF